MSAKLPPLFMGVYKVSFLWSLFFPWESIPALFIEKYPKNSPQVFFIEKCRKNSPRLWKLSPQDPFFYSESIRSPRPSGCCFTVVLLLFDLGAGSAAGSLFYGSENSENYPRFIALSLLPALWVPICPAGCPLNE